MRIRKLSSLTLALVLVASLMAVSPAMADDIMTPYGKYEETVVMTTAKGSPSAPNFLDNDTAENNPMTRYIKDRVNVEIKIAWEVDGTEFANKMSLMIVAGDLPDMFALGANEYLLFKQLQENDMLADLREPFEACANDYVKNTLGTYNGLNFEPFIGENGELHAFAGGRYGYEHNQLWLRQDWLDASGLAVPTTVAEIEAVLQEWKDNPPTEGYVGMALHDRNVGGPYDSGSASPLFASLGAFTNMWIRNDAGEIVWGSVQPEVKEGLKILADWYKKGLIDQQFATRTAGGSREALVTGGLTGSIFAPWWFTYAIGDFPSMNPEGEIISHNAPLDVDGKFTIAFPGTAGDYIMVNKNYANPEALFKVINCEFDMWRGFDPVAAELVRPTRENNVSWGYMFPTSWFNIEPMDVVPRVGEICKALVETGSVEGYDVQNPQWLQVAEAAQRYSKTGVAEGVDWIEYYGRYKGCNIMWTPEVEIQNPAYYFVTESMADIKPNLDTLEQTTFLKIVMGELDIDAFDEFVDNWHAQGGQKVTDEVRAIVK